MENETNSNQISWTVSEYESHAKNNNWYILAGIIAVGSIIYAYFTQNFMFILIIIIIAFLLILREKDNIESIPVHLTPQGLFIGQKFYDYDEFKNFLVLYKPQENIKNLYFEFTNGIKQRVSISLKNTDPGKIRSYLLKYLDEDLDRTGMPISEKLTKFLKL